MQREARTGLSIALAVAICCGWAGAALGQATNIAPPPKARSEQPGPIKSAVDAVDKTNEAAGLMFDGAMLAGPAAAQTSKEAKLGKGLFEKTGKVLTGATYIYDIGDAARRGDVAGVARVGAVGIVDQCVDLAIDAACAAVAGPLMPACVVGVQAAKFCGETWAGQSIGEYTVQKVEEGIGSVSRFAAEARRDQDAVRQQQSSQFEAVRSSNDSQSMAISGGGTQAPVEDGSADFMNALMGGLSSAAIMNAGRANSTGPVPTAAQSPSSQPSGCHPGHNESAHPNGCHSEPLGNR